MSTIDLYVLEDAHGEQIEGADHFESYGEAKDEAIERKCRVICYEYEFSDSYMVDDFCQPDDPDELPNAERPIRIWSAGGFK